MVTFSKRLRSVMRERNLTLTDVSHLTGIGKSSISQYLSGKNCPTRARRTEIARALGVQENYFELFPTENNAASENAVVNIPVEMAAKLMQKSKEWVVKGLRDGVFPWGYAVKMEKWSYWISSTKFTEYTGIEIPANDL